MSPKPTTALMRRTTASMEMFPERSALLMGSPPTKTYRLANTFKDKSHASAEEGFVHELLAGHEVMLCRSRGYSRKDLPNYREPWSRQRWNERAEERGGRLALSYPKSSRSSDFNLRRPRTAIRKIKQATTASVMPT